MAKRYDSAAGDVHYPSKRDAWITVVIWATALFLMVATLGIINSPMVAAVKYALAISCLAMAILSVWILYSTGYTVTSDTLIARCGPFTTVVTLDAIEEISPSRNPAASPACSLDRLHIRYEGSKAGLLVSPIDKSAFLSTLADRCSNLTLKGEMAVRETGS